MLKSIVLFAAIVVAVASPIVQPANAQSTVAQALDLVRDGQYDAAHDIFIQLASTGDGEAMYHLGAMNHSGLGGSGNMEQAVHWYVQAVKAGHAEAKFALGSLYYKGKGVPEDLARALALFTDAADAGVLAAQYNLAMMHASGLAHTEDYGAEEDKPRAYKWFTIVLAQLDDPDDRAVVEENFAFLRKQMESDEVAAGQELVDAWLAEHEGSEGVQ